MYIEALELCNDRMGDTTDFGQLHSRRRAGGRSLRCCLCLPRNMPAWPIRCAALIGLRLAVIMLALLMLLRPPPPSPPSVRPGEQRVGVGRSQPQHGVA